MSLDVIKQALWQQFLRRRPFLYYTYGDMVKDIVAYNKRLKRHWKRYSELFDDVREEEVRNSELVDEVPITERRWFLDLYLSMHTPKHAPNNGVRRTHASEYPVRGRGNKARRR